MELIVVTGMSGAGKSQALNVCEDMGYYSMDNLPTALLVNFLELSLDSRKFNKAAVVLDIRSEDFFTEFFDSLEKIDSLGVDCKIIFLDASKETIVKRYKELRRPHPLGENILKSYDEEKKLMEPIKFRSNFIIDTSKLNSWQLKSKIREFLSLDSKSMSVLVTSFGFKNGIPIDADLVFDVRFLPNPYYISELKEHSGKEEAVREYVLKWDETKIFLDKVLDLIDFLIPQYVKEGKPNLVIGFGCTGGFHRSVVLAERVGEEIKNKGINVNIYHRDWDI